MIINGNVSNRPPSRHPSRVSSNAYDWPELIDDDVVDVYRGTSADPRRQLIMRLEGSPSEIRDYLLALADAMAPIVAAVAEGHRVPTPYENSVRVLHELEVDDR